MDKYEYLIFKVRRAIERKYQLYMDSYGKVPNLIVYMDISSYQHIHKELVGFFNLHNTDQLKQKLDGEILGAELCLTMNDNHGIFVFEKSEGLKVK